MGRKNDSDYNRNGQYARQDERHGADEVQNALFPGGGAVLCYISCNADIETQRSGDGQYLKKIIQLREEANSLRAQSDRQDFDLSDIDQSIKHTRST